MAHEENVSGNPKLFTLLHFFVSQSHIPNQHKNVGNLIAVFIIQRLITHSFQAVADFQVYLIETMFVVQNHFILVVGKLLLLTGNGYFSSFLEERQAQLHGLIELLVQVPQNVHCEVLVAGPQHLEVLGSRDVLRFLANAIHIGVFG